MLLRIPINKSESRHNHKGISATRDGQCSSRSQPKRSGVSANAGAMSDHACASRIMNTSCQLLHFKKMNYSDGLRLSRRRERDSRMKKICNNYPFLLLWTAPPKGLRCRNEFKDGCSVFVCHRLSLFICHVVCVFVFGPVLFLRIYVYSSVVCSSVFVSVSFLVFVIY